MGAGGGGSPRERRRQRDRGGHRRPGPTPPHARSWEATTVGSGSSSSSAWGLAGRFPSTRASTAANPGPAMGVAAAAFTLSPSSSARTVIGPSPTPSRQRAITRTAPEAFPTPRPASSRNAPHATRQTTPNDASDNITDDHPNPGNAPAASITGVIRQPTTTLSTTDDPAIHLALRRGASASESSPRALALRRGASASIASESLPGRRSSAAPAHLSKKGGAGGGTCPPAPGRWGTCPPPQFHSSS